MGIIVLILLHIITIFRTDNFTADYFYVNLFLLMNYLKQDKEQY